MNVSIFIQAVSNNFKIFYYLTRQYGFISLNFNIQLIFQLHRNYKYMHTHIQTNTHTHAFNINTNNTNITSLLSTGQNKHTNKEEG